MKQMRSFSLLVILCISLSSTKVMMTPAATPELEKAEREFREAKQWLQQSDTNLQKASLGMSDRATLGKVSSLLQSQPLKEKQVTLQKLESINKNAAQKVDLQLSKDLLIKNKDILGVNKLVQAQINIDNARDNYVLKQKTVINQRQSAVDSYTASSPTEAKSENQDKLDLIQRTRTANEKKLYQELELGQNSFNKQLNDNNCLEVSSKDQKRKELCQRLSDQLKSTEMQLHKMDRIEDLGDVQIFMSEKKKQSIKDGVQWRESNAITMAKQAAMRFLKNHKAQNVLNK